MRLLKGSAFVLVCLLGCSSSSKTSDSTGEDSKVGQSEPEPSTPCKEDDDCRLSCLEPNNCCGEPPFCTKARHWDDHNAIQATRNNCLNFDYNTCPTPDYTVPDEVAIPVCKSRRCEVKMIKREPPPEGIDLSGYDRSCTTDADCVVVHNQPCAKCGCGSDPINAKEVERFREAIAAVKCPPYDLWPDIVCGDCMSPTPVCDGGQCKVP
jgi:hypothetical protein